MTIVTNSTPLIELSKINQLDLLQEVYGTILIPEEVYIILLVAKTQRVIPAVKPILDALCTRGTRISQRLYYEVLAKAEE